MHKYLAAVAAALLLTISPAFAGSATGTMTVTATVPSDCVFGSMSLPFSSYDSVGLEATVPLTATGSLSITCTDETSVSVGANTGSNPNNASGSCATTTCTRAMGDGNNDYLSYDLYSDSGHTSVWDNAGGTIPLTGTGLIQTINVYGFAPAGQNIPAGPYTDTVMVTATY